MIKKIISDRHFLKEGVGQWHIKARRAPIYPLFPQQKEAFQSNLNTLPIICAINMSLPTPSENCVTSPIIGDIIYFPMKGHITKFSCIWDDIATSWFGTLVLR